MTRSSAAGMIALAILAVILAVHGFGEPPVGLANNGDFGKVIGQFSLGAPPELEFQFVPMRYEFSPQYRQNPGFVSSERMFARWAIQLSRQFYSKQYFDLRTMFAVHLLLYLAFAAGLVQWNPLCVLILGDTLYAAYLASFYMDAAAILGLLLFVSCAVTRRPAIAVVGIAIFAVSKPQHAPCALPMVVWLGFQHGLHRWVRVGAMAMLAAVCGYMLAAGGSRPYHALGIYSVLFVEVLPHAANPAAELEKLGSLGLEPSDIEFLNTHAYMDQAGMHRDAFRRRFESRANYFRLGWYFLRTPEAAWRVLAKSMDEAGYQRPLLGNYPPDAGYPQTTISHRFSMWSDAKATLFTDRGVLYLLVSALLLAACAACNPPLGLALAGVAAMECVVSGLADVVEIRRHYTVFHLGVDLAFVVLCREGWDRAMAFAVRRRGDRPGRDRSAAGPGSETGYRP